MRGIVHAPRIVMELIDRMWDDAGYMGGNHTGEGPDPYPEFVYESLMLLSKMSEEEYLNYLFYAREEE